MPETRPDPRPTRLPRPGRVVRVGSAEGAPGGAGVPLLRRPHSGYPFRLAGEAMVNGVRLRRARRVCGPFRGIPALSRDG